MWTRENLSRESVFLIKSEQNVLECSCMKIGELKKDGSTVVFVHIPKTAGSTINSVLSFQYGHKNSHWYAKQTENSSVEPVYEELRAMGRLDCRLIRGHFSYGVHRRLEWPCRYISFLRDPIQRIKSFYYYAKKCEGMYWGDVSSPYSDILEFVCHSDTRLIDNLQVRYLSGCNPDVGGCCVEMLELAKQNIERDFLFVGLTERFDESLVVLADMLEWRRPLFYLKAMVNRGRPKAVAGDDVVSSEIAKRNKYDLELYEWVARRFDRQFLSRHEHYEKMLSKLRRYNKLASVCVPVPLRIYRKFR